MLTIQSATAAIDEIVSKLEVVVKGNTRILDYP
jgi:hypothetical protein